MNLRAAVPFKEDPGAERARKTLERAYDGEGRTEVDGWGFAIYRRKVHAFSEFGVTTLTESMPLTPALINELPPVAIGGGEYQIRVPSTFARWPDLIHESVPAVEVVPAMPGETDAHAPPTVLMIGELPEEGLVCALPLFLKPAGWPR